MNVFKEVSEVIHEHCKDEDVAMKIEVELLRKFEFVSNKEKSTYRAKNILLQNFRISERNARLACFLDELQNDYNELKDTVVNLKREIDGFKNT